MKNKFLITLIAFVVLAIGFAIFQSRKSDAQPSTTANQTSTGSVSETGAANVSAAIGSSSNTNSNQNMPNLTAQNGDTVLVHYTGKLTDGTVFDSSVGRGQPFAFILGAGMVIKGWDKGIAGLHVGEKKTLTISPEEGYGAQGVQDPQTGKYVIPPNATLVFDVELVDIKR